MSVVDGFGWMREAWVGALGWTLVHSVWELAALGLIGVGAMAVMRWRAAQGRYVVGMILLVMMGAVTGGTFGVLLHRSAGRAEIVPMRALPVGEHADVVVNSPHSGVENLSGDESKISAAAITERAVPFLVPCYLVVLTFLTLRLLVGYGVLRRLGRSGTVPEGDVEAMLRGLQRRMGIGRAVRLVESAAVEVPTVLGVLRPLILVPASALTGLSAENLEALLAHELAHIRRHDYLANVVQSVIETVLFYHPAVWWLSRVVRQEREHCCDDVAVRVVGSKTQYARALVSMESLRAAPASVPGALAVGAGSGSLLVRVRRLLGMRDERGVRARVSSAFGAVFVLAVVATGVYLGCSKPSDENATTEQADKALEVSEQQVDQQFYVGKLAIVPGTIGPQPAIRPAVEQPQPRNDGIENREAVVKRIIATLETVDPNSWKDHGGEIGEIRESNGVLFVHQTQKNMGEINKIVKLLQAEHHLQIGIESRVMFVDDELYKDLSARFPALLIGATREGNVPADDLSKEQIDDLLKTVVASSHSVSLSTPRVTLFNGQSARIIISKEQDFVSSGEKDLPPRGELSKVETGVFMGVNGVISADRESVAINVDLEMRRLVRIDTAEGVGSDGKTIPYQTPVLDTRKMSTVASVKSKGTVVFGGILVTPPKVPAGAAEGGHSDVKPEPKRLIVFVRPTVIIPSDTDSAK